MNVLNLLKKPRTVEQLSEAIAQTEAHRTELDARVDALRAKRAPLLLEDGGDEQLDNIDAQLATAYRDIDRSDAAIVELRRRLAEAQELARVAALDAAYARASRHLDAELALLAKYVALASEIRDLAYLSTAHRNARRAANEALRLGGDPRNVADPGKLLTRREDGHYATDVFARLALPNPENSYDPIFPCGNFVEQNAALAAATAKLST